MSAADHWRMPAEWVPHERTWMAWPSSGYTLGESEAADEARATWADVALAVSRFEPVTLVVDPDAVVVARRWIGEGRHGHYRVDLLQAPLDDAWMRDIGPDLRPCRRVSWARSTGCSTAGVPRSGQPGGTTPASASSSPGAPARRGWRATS